MENACKRGTKCSTRTGIEVHEKTHVIIPHKLISGWQNCRTHI